MNELIQQASSQLGISEDQAKSATGGILGMIKDKADSGDFSQLLDKLPGASALLEGGGSGGGGLGGLMSKATSSLGGGLGSGAGLVGMLSSSGLGTDKVGSFVSMFVNFIKEKAGADVVNNILGKVPELKKLIG